jgi:maleate isomerase
MNDTMDLTVDRSGDASFARRRVGVGVIVPSANTVLERDFPRVGIAGVDFYFTRILNSEDTEEQLSGMKALAGGAAELLSHTRACRAIAFCCTSGSFLKGHGYDAGIVELMETASGLPCITTAGSVVKALHQLGIRRPMVFTPYEEWLSNRSVTFLESHGFQVSGHRWGFGMTRTEETDDFDPITRWVTAELQPQADGIFISCTNFSWLRGVAPLEAATGLPVVTSNSATLWNLLRTAHVDDTVPNGGNLLS